MSRLLTRLGYQFSQLDAFRLLKAIRDLKTREERTDDNITLFGRIGPYWVLRADTQTYPEEPEEEQEDDEADDDEADAEGEGEEEAKEDSKDEELAGLEEQWAEIQAAE